MTKTRGKKTSTKRGTKMLAEGMSVERAPEASRRRASCVLEVLAGIRTPEDAASALEISVSAYYQLETRALRSLVHGCTSEPPGRRQALEKRLCEAEAECAELSQQLNRYRALLRTAQQSAGVLAESSDDKPKARARKPRVRALRAIDALGGAGKPDDGERAS